MEGTKTEPPPRDLRRPRGAALRFNPALLANADRHDHDDTHARQHDERQSDYLHGETSNDYRPEDHPGTSVAWGYIPRPR
jgi:hypothetical protein